MGNTLGGSQNRFELTVKLNYQTSDKMILFDGWLYAYICPIIESENRKELEVSEV